MAAGAGLIPYCATTGLVRTVPKAERAVAPGLLLGAMLELLTVTRQVPLAAGVAVPNGVTPALLVTSTRMLLPAGRDVVPLMPQS